MQNCPICGGTVGDGVCLSCGYKIPTEKDIVTPVNNSDTPDWAEMDSISVPSAESVSQELAPKPASYANAKKYIPESEKEEKRLPPPTNYTHISYTPEETHEEPPKASEIFARGFVDEVKKHNMSIVDIEITKSRPSEGTQLSAILSLQFKKKIPHENVMTFISEVPGVATVEEL